MILTILIKDGAEYPCLKEDFGECSNACPNLITDEGFLILEAIKLSLPNNKRICALEAK